MLKRGASELMIKIDYSKCNGCLQCLEACPVNAITKEGTVVIDYSRCMKCRTCLISCPLNAINIK
ncbi:4Fe-4S binding protein [Paramaledivibacter caminithermalis]|uniref:4Fe-4S binding protein n=1 Tax=Paramaledivibacter caminithermalis TaxID=191027 RepID=UPI00104264F0|nr:4Fe-4S binding protein [Paramaledivibacter caminithermalis]